MADAEEQFAAPGSVLVIRDETWLVTRVERATDGWFVDVQGLSELVRDTEATFSTALDDIRPLDPAKAEVVADDSPQYRSSRLWLEATLRKTAVPLNDPNLTVSTQGLADLLPYQLNAVRKALDPEKIRPRILLADAVGLGKTLEIGMILAELVRRGRGERILVVTPRHVLEQMQFELWTRFALPFVRLDSVGIQRIRQKLPANRNPFAYLTRAIVSIDTLKSDRYLAHLEKQHWDAVVIDESHNVTNSSSQNNRLARLLSSRTDALILASATPHNGKPESFAELIRMLEPSAVTPKGELIEDEVARLIIRRHRHSQDVAQVVGGDWAERHEPRNVLVPAYPIENEIADELVHTWLHPESARSPYSGGSGSTKLFPWTLAKAFLSSPAAFEATVGERIRKLGDKSDPATLREVESLEVLRGLAKRQLAEGSAKYDALVDNLTEIGVGKGKAMRAVVFAERVPTLYWLKEKLQDDLQLKDDGCFHNPGRDRTRIIGRATVTSEVTPLDPVPHIAGRHFPRGCDLEIHTLTPYLEGLELEPLVSRLDAFSGATAWGMRLRRPLVTLTAHDFALLSSKLAPVEAPAGGRAPDYVKRIRPVASERRNRRQQLV